MEPVYPGEPGMGGYFRAEVADLKPGALYSYVLPDGQERPDPASHHQPLGVHGPSALVDHDAYPWSAEGWVSPPVDEYILYELHVGTFTPEGTFDAAIKRIPHLKNLGITAVELMPVGAFPGARNWGYDGVSPYAVQESYGGPDGLKRLVDALHSAGLAAVLDVVYNHLGPEGNYLGQFGPYFTDQYRTPWGQAVNFDGPGSDEVRRYFIDNALHWLGQYRFDALRLDAVHGIYDFGACHILAEMEEVMEAAWPGQQKLLIAESDQNDERLCSPRHRGGYGLPAQWSDDYHHCLHTLLTGERDGYYADFGQAEHLAAAWIGGFVYGGRYSAFRQRRHGSTSALLKPRQLVVCSQNHDQIGNRMMGDRFTQTLTHTQLRLAATWVMLAPTVPLIFMGEEYAETAPFQYFVSHGDAGLLEAVREGRRREFASFAWKGDVPDPADETTFMRSKLRWALLEEPAHAGMLEYYRALIRLRQGLPALMAGGGPPRTALASAHADEIGGEDARVVFAAVSHGRQRLVLAANFSHRAVSAPMPEGPPWPSTGERWRLRAESHTPAILPAGGALTEAPRAIGLEPWSCVLHEVEPAGEAAE
jgi:maltooligosyltrehalose trehalohydrolase